MPSPRPHPTLRQLTWLAAGVWLVHLLGLAWLAQRGTGPGALTLMTEPEFNRVLTPGATPPHPAADGTGTWPPPMSTVGQVVQARTLAPPATEPGNAPRHAKPRKSQQPAGAAPPPPAPTPVVAEPSPEHPASGAAPPEPNPQPPTPAQSPSEPTPVAQPLSETDSVQKAQPTLDGIEKFAINEGIAPYAWLATWPASTRLSYQLKGFFRGEFSGDARVQWQRNAERYQAQVDVSVALLLNMRMTSQGRITPSHLWPEAYEEERRGKKRGARFGDQLLQLDDGSTLPRPAQLQDAASQFVQLAQDFATGRRRLAVGETVKLTLGRPGGVDEWVYDVVAQDTLTTPLGDLAAFHLKPRPLANPRGKARVDMWFAPALQHLPARIKLSLNEDTWLDLTLTGVAQSP